MNRRMWGRPIHLRETKKAFIVGVGMQIFYSLSVVVVSPVPIAYFSTCTGGRNCRGVNPTYELEEEYAGIAVFFAKETEYGRGMGAYEQKCADEVVRGHPKVFSGRVGVKLKSLSLRAMA